MHRLPAAVRLLSTLAASLAVLGSVAPSTAGAQSRYRVVDIAPFAPGYSIASAINERGQVVGSYGYDTALDGAFLYDPVDGLTDLAPLLTGGGSPSHTQAQAINAQGVVTGHAGYPARPYRYSAQRGFEAIASPVPAETYLYIGRGINDAGVVVGQGGVTNGFLHVPGQAALQPIPLAEPSDVNNRGAIAGLRLARDAQGNVTSRRLAVLDGDEVTFLGTLGGLADNGANGHTAELSDAGVVVGQTRVVVNGTETIHAFRYTPGVGMVDIDTRGLDPGDFEGHLGLGAGSRASGLNRLGQAVGASWRDMMQPSNAFLFDDRWGMLDLNTLLDAATSDGWVLLGAADINDRGQIVGYGEFNGAPRAFLLNPLAAPVPEPGALALAAFGGLLVAGGRRRAARPTGGGEGRHA